MEIGITLVPDITLVKSYIPIFLFPLHSFVYCWSISYIHEVQFDQISFLVELISSHELIIPFSSTLSD